MTYGLLAPSKVHAIRLDRRLIRGRWSYDAWCRSVVPNTLMRNLSDQMAGGPRLPVTNEIKMKITAITSSTLAIQAASPASLRINLGKRLHWAFLLFGFLHPFPAHYSPHSFRATGITHFLENDGTLKVVQRIAGHADSRTTKLYDRRGQKVLLEDMERIRY